MRRNVVLERNRTQLIDGPLVVTLVSFAHEPRSVGSHFSYGNAERPFFIVTNGRISYRPLMTPRVPWNPLEVMQLLLAWIFALMLGQLAFNLMVPPKIEGEHTVKDGNQTLTVTFLDSTQYTHAEHNGTYQFQGEGTALNRYALTLSPEDEPEITVTFMGTLRDRIGLFATNILFVQLSALGLIALLLRYHKISWSAAFGSITDHQRTLGLPLLYGIGFVVPALGLHLVSQQLIIALGGEPTSQEAVEMVARASAPPELALQALSVVVFAPVCEELLFRGVLYPSLRDLGHRRMAIAASSLLFAAIHGSLALMLPLTVLAVVLIWLYEKTGSIVAPILMHAAFNAINFAMIKLIPQIAQ